MNFLGYTHKTCLYKWQNMYQHYDIRMLTKSIKYITKVYMYKQFYTKQQYQRLGTVLLHVSSYVEIINYNSKMIWVKIKGKCYKHTSIQRTTKDGKEPLRLKLQNITSCERSMCIKWTPINVLLILRKLFITDRRTSSIHNPLQSSPKQAYNSVWHIDWWAAQSFVGITFAFNRVNYIYMYNYLIPRLNQMIMGKGRFIVKVYQFWFYVFIRYWVTDISER